MSTKLKSIKKSKSKKGLSTILKNQSTLDSFIESKKKKYIADLNKRIANNSDDSDDTDDESIVYGGKPSCETCETNVRSFEYGGRTFSIIAFISPTETNGRCSY